MATPDADPLFNFILAHHGSKPWGRVLDAGTGEHSLRWLAALPTRSWTAVTGRPDLAEKLCAQFARDPGRQDRVLAGDWADPAFLAGQTFDAVLADYLLGALEEFAPYFQDDLFARLRPHVAGPLYVVGLEPYPRHGQTEWGRLILDLVHLRDAVTLLAGHHPFREYPRAWAQRSLAQSGFLVDAAKSFTITYGTPFVEGQINACRNNLALVADRRLARELLRKCQETLARAAALAPETDRRFGENYVICARPNGA